MYMITFSRQGCQYLKFSAVAYVECILLSRREWEKNIAHKDILIFFSQVKVREATSNDHWGPSSTLMSEIADLTYNVVAFTEIMQMIWKRLNDHGKNWRHVYKALLLLEYLIKTGSEKVNGECTRRTLCSNFLSL